MAEILPIRRKTPSNVKKKPTKTVAIFGFIGGANDYLLCVLSLGKKLCHGRNQIMITLLFHDVKCVVPPHVSVDSSM